MVFHSKQKLERFEKYFEELYASEELSQVEMENFLQNVDFSGYYDRTFRYFKC